MQQPDTASTRSGPLASVWSPAWIVIAMLVLAAGLARGIHFTGGVHLSLINQRDYDDIYAGGWCMVHHCDPYSVPVLDRVLREHGDIVDESRWMFQLPIYPPTTLMLMSPLAMLPYTQSLAAWALLNRGVWMLAILWAFLWSPTFQRQPLVARVAAVAFFFASFRINHGLTFGNPAYLAAGLMLFVTLDNSWKRRWLHAVMVFVAVIVKPQLVLPLLVLLFFRSRGSRHTVYAAVALLTIFTAATLAFAAAFPGTAHWYEGLSASLRLGQSAGVNMNPSYRGVDAAGNPMLHLQHLLGYWFADAHVSLMLSLASCGLLAVLIVIPLLKRMRRGPSEATTASRPASILPVSDLPSRNLQTRNIQTWNNDLYLTGLAATTMWMFLPVYHRWTDLSMLSIVMVWALHLFLAGHLRFRTGLAMVAVLLMSWNTWSDKLRPRSASGFVSAARSLLDYRGDAVLILLLALITVSALWSVASEDRARHA